jgi:hypothetical protein
MKKQGLDSWAFKHLCIEVFGSILLYIVLFQGSNASGVEEAMDIATKFASMKLRWCVLNCVTYDNESHEWNVLLN